MGERKASMEGRGRPRLRGGHARLTSGARTGERRAYT
jgi:hypothetical protein